MKKSTILAAAIWLGLVGVASATEEGPVVVETYSTGYFANGIKAIPVAEGADYCALSTTTNVSNLVSVKYCTITQQNGLYVLTGFADANAGVNCSMACLKLR